MDNVLNNIAKKGYLYTVDGLRLCTKDFANYSCIRVSLGKSFKKRMKITKVRKAIFFE